MRIHLKTSLILLAVTCLTSTTATFATEKPAETPAVIQHVSDNQSAARNTATAPTISTNSSQSQPTTVSPVSQASSAQKPSGVVIPTVASITTTPMQTASYTVPVKEEHAADASVHAKKPVFPAQRPTQNTASNTVARPVVHRAAPERNSVHWTTPPVQKKMTVALAPVQQPKPSQPVQADQQSFISRMVNATRGIIDRAVSWVGTRYVWGGTSRNGVDCSGLTRLLYKGEGIGLPHNARMQFKKGQPVTKTALLPGDLVFFNTRGPLTHVGIYIGNRQFLHASNPRKGVRIDSIDSPYYSKYFAGARRYKNLDNLG